MRMALFPLMLLVGCAIQDRALPPVPGPAAGTAGPEQLAPGAAPAQPDAADLPADAPADSPMAPCTDTLCSWSSEAFDFSGIGCPVSAAYPTGTCETPDLAFVLPSTLAGVDLEVISPVRGALDDWAGPGFGYQGTAMNVGILSTGTHHIALMNVSGQDPVPFSGTIILMVCGADGLECPACSSQNDAVCP